MLFRVIMGEGNEDPGPGWQRVGNRIEMDMKLLKQSSRYGG